MHLNEKKGAENSFAEKVSNLFRTTLASSPDLCKFSQSVKRSFTKCFDVCCVIFLVEKLSFSLLP